jgi:hypothetical protein
LKIPAEPYACKVQVGFDKKSTKRGTTFKIEKPKGLLSKSRT